VCCVWLWHSQHLLSYYVSSKNKCGMPWAKNRHDQCQIIWEDSTGSCCWLSPLSVYRRFNSKTWIQTMVPIWLVGGWALPLWKIWKSVGTIIPNIWEKKHLVGGAITILKIWVRQWEGLSHIWKIKIVPNHQPDIIEWYWMILNGGEITRYNQVINIW
jgi:hypothetical protein